MILKIAASPCRLFGYLALALLLAGCATAPYTGRSQFLIISEAQEVNLGEEAYRQILRESVVSRNTEANRIVRKVGQRIARIANKPDYRWQFRVIDDPDMANAFAVPGGKVAVYTGIFPMARDETGLAVILGHEVAHALSRHAGERMSQDMLVQLGGLGLTVALGSNPGLSNQVLQAYGMGANVGLILPFGRSQELEADRIGLILMAKAGYDPRVALEVWERMKKKESGSPPEFLSTHPGYANRTQQLRSWIPAALKFYRPSDQRVEVLPSLRDLNSATGKAERELLKRIQAVNKQAGSSKGARAIVEALGYLLRRDPSFLAKEMQRYRLGYGEYATLRGVVFISKVSTRRVLQSYRRSSGWSDVTQRHGVKLTDLISFLGRVLRTSRTVQRQFR